MKSLKEDGKVPSPREYLKIKYSAPQGTCKCGNCQLVPPDMLASWAAEIESLQFAISASPPEQPLTKLGSSEPLGPRYDGTTMDNQQLHGTPRSAEGVTAGETAPPEQPAAVKMYPMNLAPKDKEIIGQDTDGRVFNLRWDPDDCGENWYDVHGDQMAHPVRWMLMP